MTICLIFNNFVTNGYIDLILFEIEAFYLKMLIFILMNYFVILTQNFKFNFLDFVISILILAKIIDLIYPYSHFH